MSQRKEILLENNIYKNSLDFEKEKKIFENHRSSVEEDSNYQDVLDVKMHSLELSNWLNFAD